MTDYRKYNTNWTSPKRLWLAALNDLRKARAAGHRAALVKTRNEDCAHPIKVRNSITDFRAYEFNIGLLKTRNQIAGDHVMPEFQKLLTLNYKTCYGTPEAVKHYYDTGLLQSDNFKGVGTSHLVKVSDLIKFYSCHPNKIEKNHAEMYRQQYLCDDTRDEMYLFDHYKLKSEHSIYTIKRFRRKVWVVALLRDSEPMPRTPVMVHVLNAIVGVLKFVPKRSVLKMDDYKSVTYSVGSVRHGYEIQFKIPKKFGFK